jgi:hypothetical protein
MERRLVKDLDRMYLVFDTEDIDENEYLLQMALHGNLPSLLPLSISTIDGKTVLRADVTGCTDIAARYRTVQLTGSDIRKILTTLNDVIQKLPGFLLDPNDLCLEPEYIFLGPGADEILLTYIPHLSESATDTLRTLSEFFLKKLDHSDRIAADLAYGLYDRVQAENYTAGEVLAGLLQSAGEPLRMDGQTQEDGNCIVSGQSDIRDMRRPQPPGPGVKPPDSIRTVKTKPPSRRKNITRKSGKNRSRRKQGCRPGQKSVLKKALPVIVILSAAAALIFLFRMDLTQIGGMGFLSAALIWLTYSTLGKRRSEIHNVWADEDDPGDDAFYQSLLKQVYAEDAGRTESGEGSVQQRMNLQQEGYSQPGRYPLKERTIQPEEQKPVRIIRTGPCMVSLQPQLCPDIMLSSSHILLGKSRRKADVILPDDTVSRVHARIEHRTDGFYVSDLYSTNGTWLNDERLESGSAILLKDGDVLKMGELRFAVRI